MRIVFIVHYYKFISLRVAFLSILNVSKHITVRLCWPNGVIIREILAVIELKALNVDVMVQFKMICIDL